MSTTKEQSTTGSQIKTSSETATTEDQSTVETTITADIMTSIEPQVILDSEQASTNQGRKPVTNKVYLKSAFEDKFVFSNYK